MTVDFTIGMATFNNFDETFFTIQSLRFHHAEVIDRFEIVVVDNSPNSIDGRAIKSLIEGRVRPNGRYVPFPKPVGSCPPRGHLFDVAVGRFVCCIDSHVLLMPGALAKLVEFFDENPECDDLLHGPLVSNFGLHRLEATHMRPVWRSEMFGCWAVDERGKDPDGEPFEIPQHGLGLFAARRESWLRFHADFNGFSGGEGYLHEKYRQAGRRTLCLPGVRWSHKFSRPNGIPHNPKRTDKIRNHMIGWTSLGVDIETGKTADPLASMHDHFVGEGVVTADDFQRLAAEAGVPGYVRANVEPKTRGVVLGPTSYGSYRMRGRPIAEAFGFREFNSRGTIVPSGPRYDVALAVKCGVPPAVRKHADRVIWEPLDLWFGNRRQSQLEPAEFFRRQYKINRFDDVIVSTETLDAAARDSLPENVTVHFVPHHADPRIGLDWYDPDGPIVYAGGRDFVRGFVEGIEEAGERIGRRVVFDFQHHAWKSLRGASLVLAPRLNGRSPMNLVGKPAVKLANASQAGIPALTTPDPAGSLFSDVRTLDVEGWRDPGRLDLTLREALGDAPSAVKFPAERWLAKMEEILG